MIRLIIFFGLIRVKKNLDEESLIFTIFQASAILYGAVLGFMLGQFLDALPQNNIFHENSIIEKIIIIIICLFPIIFNIIFYKPKTNLIPKLYPINIFEKTVIEFIYDLFNFEFLVSLSIVSLLFISSEVFNFVYLFFSLSLLFFINILINIYKLIIERNITLNKGFFIILILYCLFVLFIFNINLILFSIQSAVYLIILTTFSFITLVFFEKFERKPISKISYFFNQFINRFILLIWLKTETRQIILAFVLGKILSMSSLAYFFFSKNQELDNMSLLFSLLLIIPNMGIPIFANIWGNLPDIWLLLKHNNTYDKLVIYFQIYKQIMLPSILFDSLWTYVWAYNMKIYNIEYYFFYISISIIMFLFGFISSTMLPYFYKNYSNSNIGISVSFVFMFLCILLLLPLWNKWFYFIYLVLIITTYYCYKKLPDWVESRKYINYKNLFNS